MNAGQVLLALSLLCFSVAAGMILSQPAAKDQTSISVSPAVNDSSGKGPQ
jgi:hypothetical protein